MIDRRKLAKEFLEYGPSEQYKIMLKLLDTFVDDLRKANDDAEPNQVLQNQGGIKSIKTLRKLITIPEKRMKHFDGGFNL